MHNLLFVLPEVRINKYYFSLIANLYSFQTHLSNPIWTSFTVMGIGNGSIKRSQCQCFVVAVSATATTAAADYGVVVDDDGDGDASQQLSLFHIKT